jgi:hypothetical protein
VSQPYLSQLESGTREAGADLVHRAVRIFRLPATSLPLKSPAKADKWTAEVIERRLASLRYPGFEHIRPGTPANPAEVVLGALGNPDLDTRLVEALPWVLVSFRELDWNWLRDQAKLRNLQNRLGYTLHLARQLESDGAGARPWPDRERELEDARLAAEGTLCRDSMPEPEREWLRTHRPKAARHWNLLTGLTVEQLPYAER